MVLKKKKKKLNKKEFQPNKTARVIDVKEKRKLPISSRSIGEKLILLIDSSLFISGIYM